MKNLLVSIVTVTFNRVKYLEETILSVKNQDYPNLEHIIIDGGSTDGTVELLKRYEREYNMKWISKKDKGITDALNKGFKMARGEILCWIDSDDIYLPGAIKEVMSLFKKYPKIDLVFGDIIIIDNKGQKIDYIKYTDFDFNAWVYEGGGMNPAASFWRKSLYEKVGGLNEKYMWSPDIYFFTQAGSFSANFFHVRKFLSKYRYHLGQILGNEKCVRDKNNIFNVKKWERKEIFKKYYKGFSQRDLYIKKKKALFKRMIGYIKNGDVGYVVRGILRRSFNLLKTK